MALGSVVGQLPADMAITEDPRLDEEHLYGVRRELGDPRTTFAWVDAEDPDLEATLQKLGTLPGPRLLIAHRALSAKENFELNARIAAAIDLEKFESRRYLPVDARFKTADEWQAYVRALPEKRPDDLHIQLTAPGTEVTLCEGQYAIRAPWHFYVHRVRRWGVPGQSSHIAVAQEHAQLDADMIRDSTRQIAAGAIRITH